MSKSMKSVKEWVKPAEARGSPRKPAEARGSPRKPAEARGSPRKPAEARGSPRKPAEARGSPRKPAEARGSPRKPAEARDNFLCGFLEDFVDNFLRLYLFCFIGSTKFVHAVQKSVAFFRGGAQWFIFHKNA
jgi:hypothetical protein